MMTLNVDRAANEEVLTLDKSMHALHFTWTKPPIEPTKVHVKFVRVGYAFRKGFSGAMPLQGQVHYFQKLKIT